MYLTMNMVHFRSWMCLVIYLSVNGVKEWVTSKIQTDTIRHVVTSAFRGPLTIILFDSETDLYAQEISSWIDDRQYIFDINVENAEDYILQHLKLVVETSTSVEAIRSRLQFIVICRECCNWLIRTISAQDKGLQTMRHFSSWLFLVPYQDTLTDYLNTQIDNIAIIKLLNLENRMMKGFMTTYPMESFTLTWAPVGRAWTRVNLLDRLPNEMRNTLFPNIRNGLNGRELVVATMQWYPWTMRQGVGENMTFVGTSNDILNNLAKIHNFTFVSPEDNKWGTRLENGTWTGIIGMISKQVVDLTGAAYSFSESRVGVMDISVPVDNPTTVAMYARKRDGSYFWKYLLRCFQWQVYVVCAAAIVCASVIYSCLIYIMNNYVCSGKDDNFKLTLMGVTIPLRQGVLSEEEPKNVATRVFLFSWCLQCFLITAIYSGGLVAYATVEKPETPFRTLQELAEQSDYVLTGFEGNAIVNIMKTSKNAVYAKLYSKMKTNLIPMTDHYLERALELILHQNYVLLADKDSMYILKSNSCEIQVMKEEVLPSHSGIGFNRGSPLKKLFDKTYAAMVETDYIQETKRKWLPTTKVCSENRQEAAQFKLIHLQISFVICAAGVGMALLTLLLEMCAVRHLPRGRDYSEPVQS